MNNLFLRNRMCFPVKGFNRGIIYDLTRMDYHFIPLNLFRLINTNEIITQAHIDGLEVDEKWTDSLKKNEVIFPVESAREKDFFPSSDMSFEIPNSIVSLVIHDNFILSNMLFLNAMYVSNVSIICDSYDENSYCRIKKLLEELSKFEIDSIYLYVKKHKSEIIIKDIELLERHPQLFSVFLFDNFEINLEQDEFKTLQVHSYPYSFEEYISSMTQDKLGINYSHFFESQNFHNYFYKKVYIDDMGEVKNGLLQEKSYGNIDNVDVFHIINSECFQKLWYVKKEKTLICKECEFRYMCVDPRAPKQNDNEEWYHEYNCNYNPYISKWKHEDNYLKLEDCGVTLNEFGVLHIDEKICNTVFETTWFSCE